MPDFEESRLRVFLIVNNETKGKFLLNFIPRAGDIFSFPVRRDYDKTGERMKIRVTEVEITLYEPDPDVPIDIYVHGASISEVI